MARAKRVLLVGVSTGVGYLAAERILEHDASVYAAAPDVEPMEPLAARGAHLLEMDVADAASVQAGVERVIAEQGGIDCVHFNAGIHVPGPIEAVPQDLVERLYQVNLFGAGRVLRAVTPQLRKQRGGRVILTGSAASHASAMMMGWYASTKHALYAMATAYRQEVREFGVEVVLVEPGPIRTEFDRAGLTRLQAMEWPEDYEMDLRRYRKGLEAMLKTSPSPERTAKTIERAVFAARPRAIYRTTLFAKLAPFLGFALSPGIWDRLIRMQLSRQGPE